MSSPSPRELDRRAFMTLSTAAVGARFAGPFAALLAGTTSLNTVVVVDGWILSPADLRNIRDDAD
jgi:hypothetical protein